MLIPGEKCRHFIPGKKFQGKNVDIFSPRIENSIPRNGEIVFLEKRARHHLNPLPNEASRAKWEPEKKDPLRGSFFFLPAFGLCRPSVSAHPANRIRCSSNIAIADHFPSKTFSFKHHSTGEAWPACRAILPFHSNTTQQTRHGQLAEQFYLFIQTPLDRQGMARLQSNSTFSFKHHLTGEAWRGLEIRL